MGGFGQRLSAGVSYEGGDVLQRSQGGFNQNEQPTYDFNKGQVLQVGAPGPDRYKVSVRVSMAEEEIVPATIIRAHRYGSGSVRLNESSCGSTEGSPSMVSL